MITKQELLHNEDVKRSDLLTIRAYKRDNQYTPSRMRCEIASHKAAVIVYEALSRLSK